MLGTKKNLIKKKYYFAVAQYEPLSDEAIGKLLCVEYCYIDGTKSLEGTGLRFWNVGMKNKSEQNELTEWAKKKF